MNDLVLDKNYKKGSKGKKVRLIQEWLCLQGFGLCIDGVLGPAKNYAVRRYNILYTAWNDRIFRF